MQGHDEKMVPNSIVLKQSHISDRVLHIVEISMSGSAQRHKFQKVLKIFSE